MFFYFTHPQAGPLPLVKGGRASGSEETQREQNWLAGKYVVTLEFLPMHIKLKKNDTAQKNGKQIYCQYSAMHADMREA